MKIVNLLFAFALIGSLVLGCSMMKGQQAAEPAVERFHQQFNDKKFQEMYAATDTGFKENTTEKDFTDLMEAVHRKLGTVQHVNRTGLFVNTNMSGTFATLTCEVEFSEGKGSEKFVFHLVNDKALLFNYNVNSPLLITK